MPVSYHRAAVCGSGHVLDSLMNEGDSYPGKFCPRCGEPVYTACPSCGSPVVGADTRTVSCGIDSKPNYFCICCGNPYPWTLDIIESNQRRINELDQLDDQTRQMLCESLEDIVIPSPDTPVACDRFKRVIASAGSAVREILLSLLGELACSVAKKHIGL